MAIGADGRELEFSPGKAIYQLIVEAKSALRTDRRSDLRYAFFRPVSIEMDDGQTYSGFTREISEGGIGLIHNIDLKDREVQVSIRSDCGYLIRVRTTIAWCSACGDGWYISGGQFTGIGSIGH